CLLFSLSSSCFILLSDMCHSSSKLSSFIIIMNKFVLGHVACTVNLAKMVLIFPPMFWSSFVPMSNDFSILVGIFLSCQLLGWNLVNFISIQSGLSSLHYLIFSVLVLMLQPAKLSRAGDIEVSFFRCSNMNILIKISVLMFTLIQAAWVLCLGEDNLMYHGVF
ncbi:hypothetical protein L9F63_023425, partial [Diploptera punctata]